MSGLSGIGGVGGYLPPQQQSNLGGDALQAPAASGSASPGGSILAVSSSSISASMETLMSMDMPMLASNEALGAALLLLVLQYLQTGDSNEKQQLLDVIASLAASQKGGGAGGSLMLYSSSSMSIENTQMLLIAPGDAAGAYSGASALNQQAPQIDAGSAGLDLTA